MFSGIVSVFWAVTCCRAGVFGYDTPAYIDFEKTAFTVAEDQTNLVIAVVRTGEFRDTARVDFRLVEGTATEGADYKQSGGTIIFAAGQSFKTITIPIVQDAEVEGDETLKVELFDGGVNVVLMHSSATVTIKDVPPAPQLPQLVIHPNSDGTVTVSWDDTGASCVLERSDCLEAGSWETVSTLPVGADGKWCVVEPASATFHAYRLRSGQ